MAYWDTSCLVKLYAPEPDSAVFEAYVISGVSVVTSAIARWELWATLRRKEASGDLRRDGARQALQAYDADIAASLIIVHEIDSPVVAQFEAIIDQCLGKSPPLALRTSDAIHLATAIASGETEVVATDKRLREAALLTDFTVYPPP